MKGPKKKIAVVLRAGPDGFGRGGLGHEQRIALPTPTKFAANQVRPAPRPRRSKLLRSSEVGGKEGAQARSARVGPRPKVARAGGRSVGVFGGGDSDSRFGRPAGRDLSPDLLRSDTGRYSDSLAATKTWLAPGFASRIRMTRQRQVLSVVPCCSPALFSAPKGERHEKPIRLALACSSEFTRN